MVKKFVYENIISNIWPMMHYYHETGLYNYENFVPFIDAFNSTKVWFHRDLVPPNTIFSRRGTNG